MPATPSLAERLRSVVRGSVSARPADLHEGSVDFGGVVRREPRLVVRPLSAEDVAEVLTVARAEGLAVATRSAGHSLGGQTLVAGGIQLDMRAMHTVHRIDEDERWFEAEPGTVWRDLTVAALDRGLVPPVLTGTLRTTIGGTHSVGGMGHASFRYGAQVDQCLALEVVTPDGRIRWCSEEREPELFRHVLAGFGQLGVITRVRGRLRPAPATITWAVLMYANRARMLADLRRAAASGRMDWVGGYGSLYDGERWLYTLDLAADGVQGDGWLAELQPDRVRIRTTRPYREHLFRCEDMGEGEPRNAAMPGGNPWVDTLLPADAVEPYLREALRTLPREVLRRSTMLAWPLDGARFTRPLFRSPDGGDQVLASIFPTMDASGLAGALPAMAALARRAELYGGKRYLYGWVDLDEAGWARHYGDAWEPLCGLKRQYDADGVLNPDFIRYPAARQSAVPR